MFGSLLYDFLFLGVPAILIVLFFVSLFLYVSAKQQNRKAPGTVPPEVLKRRKIFLIVFAVIAGVIVVVFAGVAALLFLAIAFM